MYLKLLLSCLVVSFSGCITNEVIKTGISIEIVPESKNGDYYISWKDTIGLSNSQHAESFLFERKNELHCFVTNSKKDTIGYYSGLSMPGQWTYFKTKTNKDSIIYLNFRVGINHFSSALHDYSQDQINQFYKQNKKQVQFKPVNIYLDTALRKIYNIELTQ
ncbi:MAG: hypothetical protein ACPGU5_03625 [Lishizhenia sp.]